MTEKADLKKWFYKPSMVLLGLILLGPFVFPILWDSPHFNRFWKILLTILVIGVTIYSIYFSWETIMRVFKQVKDLGLI